MNENQNLLKEAEILENSLDFMPEWTEFGQILDRVHESIYQKPSVPVQVAQRTKSHNLFRRSVSLSVSVLILLILTFGLFYENRPLGNGLSEYEPELDWEDGELDLELFDEQLERVADESSLELEYAILEDSLSEWIGESDEEELF